MRALIDFVVGWAINIVVLVTALSLLSGFLSACCGGMAHDARAARERDTKKR